MNIKKLHWRYAYETYAIKAFIGDQWLNLRVCAHGYDEDGEIRHTLYCTADGRFFHRLTDGFRELRPANLSHPRKNKAAGGGHDCPILHHPYHLYCHKLVCTAFHGLCSDGYECDHLNGNHLDWSAENLQWVTPEENRRRAKCARRLRKIGISPKWLSYWVLLLIYQLNADDFEHFIEMIKQIVSIDSSPLSIDAIEGVVLMALDRILYSRIRNQKSEIRNQKL